MCTVRKVKDSEPLKEGWRCALTIGFVSVIKAREKGAIPCNKNCFSLMLGMQEASMKLTEALHEVYEPDWYGREDVKMVGEVRAGL